MHGATWNSSIRTRSLLLDQIIAQHFFKCDVVTSTVCRDLKLMFRELSGQSQLLADRCSFANCFKSCHCFTTAHHFRTVASMVFLLTFRSVFLLHARSTQKRSFVEMSPFCLERHNVNDDVFICLRATFVVEKKIRFVGDRRVA